MKKSKQLNRLAEAMRDMEPMLTDKIVAALVTACAAPCTGEDQKALLYWAHNVTTDWGVLQNILNGSIEVVGMNDDGPRMRVTEKGLRDVEALLPT